jgi:DNA-binding HxlR family transcriptional regulator
MRDHHACPVQATINGLSGPWKVQILWHLALGATRFSQVPSTLSGISDEVLADQLRPWEADGPIARRSTGTPPQRVRYSLSDRGRRLVPMREALCAWGSAHFGVVSRFPPLPRARQGRVPHRSGEAARGRGTADRRGVRSRV